MGLEPYRQKRDFSRTREPAGRKSRRKGNAFVVQKHAARRLHYDFRLELDGVLLSWAVPKGPSLDPKVKRLAMHVEDHPKEYQDFEGVIPKGEYGGGTVIVWDRGTWKPEGDAAEMYRRGRLSFELEGEKLHGRFHLVRTGGGAKNGERRWLLMKSSDDAAQPGTDDAILEQRPESVISGRDIDAVAKDPDHVWTSKQASRGAERAGRARKAVARLTERAGAVRAKLPAFVEPELATLVDAAPAGDDWLHELKLDGYRILARIDGAKVRLLSRRSIDWTGRMPSIASALSALGLESGFIDGEVVVLDESGKTSFQRLQNSLEAGKDAACVYFVFDAPFLDGYDLRKLPLLERKAILKERLAALAPGHARLRYSEHIVGGGPLFFSRACGVGAEGIISKRARSQYVSGRGKSWLKVKCLSRQEFVVGGYTEPGGSRGHFGALLLGAFEDGELKYAGKVGTGFSEQSLRQIAARLRPLEQSEPPFANPPTGAERRGVHWVAPRLVAEVTFAERTDDGHVRHASFHGLREDKPARDVHPEQPQALAKAKAAPKERSAPAPKTKKKRAAPNLTLDPARLQITNPDKVLYPDRGLTKRDLLLYYASVARWMLPHVSERPLMLVRCPEGAAEQCFHQKHASKGMPQAVETVAVGEKKGEQGHLMIRSAEGLLGLVQMGALEIHTWGSRADDIERPDQLVFDLDPDEALGWERVVEAAEKVRAGLEKLGLTGFVKTTGGKGLHVVVPIEPELLWDDAKRFCKGFVDALVKAEPQKYLATMSKQKRSGKVFLDYFRNGRGATAVCVYSSRARSSASVSAPVSWKELSRVRSDQFTIENLPRRLAALKHDPWEEFDDARAAVPR